MVFKILIHIAYSWFCAIQIRLLFVYTFARLFLHSFIGVNDIIIASKSHPIPQCTI